MLAALLAATTFTSFAYGQEGNLAAPAADTVPMDLSARQSPWGRWNIDIDHKDRVYAAGDGSSITVTDPSTDMLLGVIPLEAGGGGDTMVRGSTSGFAHGFAYAPNGRTLAVASGKSGIVSFVDTGSNRVIHTARVGGSPAGAAYTPNGKEVWIPVRGGNYISVLDADGFAEVARIDSPSEPGMTIFSNNGRYAYVCSGVGATVFDVRKRSVVGSVPLGGSSCPSIAATPDGKQIWLTSLAVGGAVAFSAKPPFQVLRAIDTGPRTNGVNFVSNDDGQFAYVSVAALNAVKVIDTQTFETIATIPVGMSPSGVWPSGDGSRVYVGLGKDEAIAVIDAAAMKVIDSVKVGQAAQSVVYVPYAVRSGRGDANLRRSTGLVAVSDALPTHAR